MAKCNKCDADNESGAKFCEECGTKLKKITVKKEKIELLKNKKLLISTVVILILATIFVFAIPLPYTAKEGYNEKVPYEAEEKYTEKEPYSATETYYESESYQDELCEEKIPKYVLTETDRGYNDNNYWYNSYDITNLENQIIVLNFQEKRYRTSQSNIVASYNKKTITLQPSENKKYTYNSIFDYNDLQDVPENEGIITDINAEPITKCSTVTKSREIPQTRTITKYRDVTNTRTVTKYKDEYKERSITKYATLFQQLTGKVEYYTKTGV